MSDITRKQTIKVLESMRKGIRCGELYIENEEAYQGQIAALDFAIKALEQEPTTKNDLGVDCIVDVLGSYTDLDIPYKREIAENILTKLSSVTPQEPKTGKWISTETKGVRYAFWCRYKCSLCGGLSDHTNFCPNCGAKMESEDKE